ncbi:nucleotide-diphospho-sugar transferase [Foetidibacter luteolus]|uniref:nucleotide-diphospho-sugar transferase n=1 Tax=Foetidibacter luteolus TaxID=2608880 RepID=UPI00129A3B74|nr:nucleotide-diphospho-sugar transferase [Foetidibacter luteolus]
MTSYIVQSPVLLLIFNRPDLGLQVFNAIKAVKPSKLYIAADGPRQNNTSDIELCNQARAITQLVDWDCTVKTLFRTENKGCKVAVSSAIDWFFEQEEEGIILEDDCLPVTSFFFFCDKLLQHYRFDTRIHNITGTNLQNGQTWGDGSYYLSQYSNIWGWASWRRVWKKYDASLAKYTEENAQSALENIFTDRFLIQDWIKIFNDLKQNKIDTWDYQLNFITFFENGLCITPNVNLIRNIGFRNDATHTFDPANHHADLAVGEIEHITHPICMYPQKAADYYFIKKEFGLEERWKRYNKKTKRFKRWVRGLFK